MKKILFVSNIPEHLSAFHYPYMKWFKDIGWEVHVATASSPEIAYLDYCDKKIEISVNRKPFHLSNIKAYYQLKKIIRTEKYDLIHCNTEVPSVLTILAARKFQKNHNTKVIHTAHGFWFFKGSPIVNWMFYPITKYCAKYTDCLITINKEDYELAKSKMRADNIFLVNGVGFNNKFNKKNEVADRHAYKKKYGINENTIMLLSVGELNDNKNHRLVIEALSDLREKNVVYYIAGEGDLHDKLEEYVKEKNLDNTVKILGFREDVDELMRAADIFVFPSKREGLSVSLMEAMASSLPCIVSDVRGNNDLIDENGGILFESNNLEELKRALIKLLYNDDKREIMGNYNKEKSNEYSVEKVLPIMKKIYSNLMN